MKKLNKNYLGWNSKDHLISFNFWNDLSNYEFNFRWGSFRENQIISEVLKKGDSLFEVGCATGTTVRWLKNTGILSKIKYLGVDISDTAISKANFLHPKVNFKKIFEPGYTSKKRGWGLGLSLSKRIIEEYHKGSISVKWSEIGKGTTFRIVLSS